MKTASQFLFVVAAVAGFASSCFIACQLPASINSSYYLSGSFRFASEAQDAPLSQLQGFLVTRENQACRPGLASVIAQTTGSASENSGTTAYSPVVALMIGLFLLVCSAILLFQIRKRQIIAAKTKVLEEERNVLFNNAPCGYHTLNGEGVIINANYTLLHWLGYERGEVIGNLKFGDIVIGDAEAILQKLSSTPKNKRNRVDVTLRKKNGDQLPVILGVVEMGDLPAAAGERLFSSVDNTRCHEALERIKTLDQELEAFSYSISHDLRAPLRSIDGYSRILEEDYAQRLDEEGRRVLNVVMNNARRMGKLIDDLLDFGRLGRRALQKTNVNMTGIVESTVQELKGLEPGRRMQITVEQLMPASADAEMIKQVWYNLLENAFKFTGKKENANISVRSYRLEQNEVCYEVKDNGVGFDMQYGAKLFGIFQRLHKMQDFSGTGVGLAIVKRIITRHGGRVWAQSAVNDGATFFFTLPTDDEHA